MKECSDKKVPIVNGSQNDPLFPSTQQKLPGGQWEQGKGVVQHGRLHIPTSYPYFEHEGIKVPKVSVSQNDPLYPSTQKPPHGQQDQGYGIVQHGHLHINTPNFSPTGIIIASQNLCNSSKGLTLPTVSLVKKSSFKILKFIARQRIKIWKLSKRIARAWSPQMTSRHGLQPSEKYDFLLPASA